MIFQINTFSISRLNNAEYTGFMINLQKVMQELEPEQLGLDHEQASEFNRVLNLLIDQVYTTAGSQYTAAMQAADQKRDRLYKKIRLKLQAVDIAEEGSSLLPIVDLVNTYLLSKYSNAVPQKPYQEETAILQGFIYDLRDKLTSGQQKELAITDDIDSLEAANDEFVTAYNSRVGEVAAGDKELTAKLRQQLLEMYRLFCIQTQYSANIATDGKEDVSTACQQFISLVNQLLVDAKKRLDQRQHKGESNVGEEGEGDKPSEDNVGEEGEGDKPGEDNVGEEGDDKPTTGEDDDEPVEV